MRLIDADKLKAKQQEDADLFIGDNTFSGLSRRDEALNAVANIVNAPTVDPVKHGRWVDKYGDGDWHCTRCGAIVEKHEQDYKNWYFCYHCGAKMDEKPCDDCQEFDCYGCEYAERRTDE